MRFRFAREAADLKLSELARSVGVNVNTLATYEHGRSPFPYQVGSRISEATNTCQRWLATGASPRLPHIKIDEVVNRLPVERALFSQVYFAILAQEIEVLLHHLAGTAECEVAALQPSAFAYTAPLWAPETVVFLSTIKTELEAAAQVAAILDDSHKVPFMRELAALVTKYFPAKSDREQRRELEEITDLERAEIEWKLNSQWSAAAPNQPKKVVAVSRVRDILTAQMKSMTLDRVLSDVARLTDSAGAQSALAKHLGVSRQRVSEWVKRKSAPNGEMALRLAAWVSAPEQQTKSPDRARTRPGQTTRKDESTSNEKAKSNRPKG